MTEPIDTILERLEAVKIHGNGWQARCSAHDDNHPSLSVGLGDNGTVLLRCHAGCSTDNIVDALGLNMCNLFPASHQAGNRKVQAKRPNVYSTIEVAIADILRWPSFKGGRHTKTWDYQHADGTLAFHVARFDFPDGGKQFRPIRPVDGKWVIGSPPGKLPLYHLPELAEADCVFIVEGEKCADAARSIGLTATTSAFGSKSPGKTDWTPLRGKSVVILPDNDEPGRKYAQTVAPTLVGLGCRVRVITLPGLPEVGDLVDYVEAKECVETADIRRGIEELADTAPVRRLDGPPTDSLPDDPGPDWYIIGDILKLPHYRQGIPPISTGFGALDEPLRGGLRPECVYVIAGRTGTSKSTLALNIARRVAIDGHCVLVFKLEESSTEAVWRIHAAAAQVPLNRLLDGVAGADDEQKRKLADAWELIHDLPIRVSGDRQLEDIQRISRAHVESGGKLIVLDQISMVDVPHAQIGYEQATAVSNALRHLARDLRVPILAVSQINRQASKATKDHLSVHDLRDSGQLENDAAAGILIDKVRKPREPHWTASELVRYLDIIIGKNRYGPRTDPDRPLTLVWWPEIGRIEDESREPVEVDG